ncbi:DNA repair protein RAD51 homolog 4 [Drosophila pseudoobscura]|uniref:DNA repair protein RAD51 homolog 4 n=1 Tax=Drosophila pseudoobscura pseudoobscura TaxID=46245 RepID=A0A6I8UVN2_DROPS|nr:DNA repair protein RAD51 homolog 4 [Drosophila pseudoobscura]
MDLKNKILQTPTGKKLLSEYQLNLLTKNNIETVLDFHDAENQKLHNLLAIKLESVLEIKKELDMLPWQSETFVETVNELDFGTGIEELDKFLDSIAQPFRRGRVWEVCGQTGVGKTQLMYTLALNFVWKHKRQVLFIDTKQDFSTKRIQDMLMERKVDQETSEKAMADIHVVEVLTSEELIEVLKAFDQQMTDDVQAALKTKVVVVDSLAACFVDHRGREMRRTRDSLLTEVACRVRKLAVRGVAFVIGNISFSQDSDNCDDDGLEDGNSDGSTRQPNKPMLGSYWSSVCTLRLSLELPESTDCGDSCDDDGLRMVNVMTNTYGPAGDTCLLRITDAGLV